VGKGKLFNMMRKLVLFMSNRQNELFWFTVFLLSIPVVINEFVFQLNDFYYGVDYWEHTGVFAEWMKNLWSPGMPHIYSEEAGRSARYMPFFFVLTFIGRLFDLSPIQIMTLASFSSMAIIFIGIKLFFKTYFKHEWAPVIGLVVFFCCWGFGWVWSNLYQLRSMIYVSGYPSSFTFGLSLIALWNATNYLRNKHADTKLLVVTALLAFLMFTCHPLTGAFGIGAVGLLAFTEPDVNWRNRIYLVAALILGAALTEFWPYYSAWQVALGTTVEAAPSWITAQPSSHVEQISRFDKLTSGHAFYNLQQFFVSLGPALIGFPVCIWFLYKRQQLFIAVGFLLMMLPYIGNLIFKIPLGHRFLLFAMIFLHFAIVWLILQFVKQQSTENEVSLAKFPNTRLVRIATITLVLIGLMGVNLGLSALEFYGLRISPSLSLWYRQNDTPRVTEQVKPLAEFVPHDAILMVPQLTSWPVSSFVAKTVALHHNNPYVNDGNDRNRATRKFFAQRTTSEERLEILAAYDVTHIAYINNESDYLAVLNDMLNSGYRVADVGQWIVLTKAE
jgi:hypothetical protein